ncbi:MAG: peptidoglycan DD-metalloendopeptidase family protein [Kiloniellaceae bacterium]
MSPRLCHLPSVGLAALVLAGCTGMGPSRVGQWPTAPDPPPIPLRKPAPPNLRPAIATAPVAPLPAAHAVTTGPLAPLGPVETFASAPAVRAGAGGHTVRRGDTVYGIARRFGVPIRTVIDANGLRPPYALRFGQTLIIPKPRRHVVQKGDTVYGISRRYGVDMTELVRLNRIAPPYAIAPGQGLLLPVPARPPAPIGRIVVRDSAKPGTPAGGTAATPARVPKGAQTPTQSAGVQTAAIRTAAPIPAEPIAPGAGVRPAAIPQPPPRAGGKFLWPVRGKLIAGYGVRKGGWHNDGINIAAPRGAPVRAAENGVVAYAGNELRGFGNLLLIKHAGGWVTAYAHNEGFLVKRGETVKRGQVIARIGSSGNVSRPQLHFEIRKGTRAIDPTRLLGAQRAGTGN